MRCMLCGKNASELQLIESVFPYDAVEVSRLLGTPVEGELGGDTLTVCPGACADEVRVNSTTILRDEPFEEGK